MAGWQRQIRLGTGLLNPRENCYRVCLLDVG
jgi:hypothetical protein